MREKYKMIIKYDEKFKEFGIYIILFSLGGIFFLLMGYTSDKLTIKVLLISLLLLLLSAVLLIFFNKEVYWEKIK